MLAKVKSVAPVGLDCEEVEVEVDLANGLPCFNIVGLPDKAVEEAKERVKSAIKNSGGQFPQKRITVNLAPANIKKEGASFDLPIAVGILAASEQIKFDFENAIIAGELSLSGRLRRIKGVLPIAINAQARGYKSLFIPTENANEAAVIEGIATFGVPSLKSLVLHFREEKQLMPEKTVLVDFTEKNSAEVDFADIKGQEQAKRALEIAAAGGHNLIMTGPPGSGKTLLAKALGTILPNLTFDESLEVSKIYSVAGLFPEGKSLLTQRPFRNPHHSASDISLVGGGAWPKPGEISLAHRGIMFLDEFPEFPRSVIEMLRQPLEDGTITISRASSTLTFPAKFILVAAQNPCPCGYLNDPVKSCTCSSTQILKYGKKISGPILDRIDLHINVPRVKNEKLIGQNKSENSTQIRKRVEMARKIQNERLAKSHKFTNAEMDTYELREFCSLDQESQKLLKNALDRLYLSARSYSKILKVARTIADLDQSKNIQEIHLAEALQYRPSS